MNTQLDSYLRMLAGPREGRAGRFLDVRWPLPFPTPEQVAHLNEAERKKALRRVMGKHYYEATHLESAAGFIDALARVKNVFIGVALHDRKAGDRSSVSHSHLLWADVDREDAQDRISTFPHPPTMVVASGSPGRRHAYWLLDTVQPIGAVMVANRKLAGALGGDLMMGQSPVSMLRPAGTFNYKRDTPAPVQIIDLAGSRRYPLEQLVDGLDDPQPPRPPAPVKSGPITGIRLDNPSIDSAHHTLKHLDAREWMPRLTGVELVADDRMCCPFHDDDTPSLKAYPNGSWKCYGCGLQGDIIEFACRLADRPCSGADFIEVRAELARSLLGVELPTPGDHRHPAAA